MSLISTEVEQLTHVEPEEITAVVTSDWVDLGGQFLGIPAPIFFGGSLFTFTRNTDNSLGMCKVKPSGGIWSTFGASLAASPAVALSPNGAIGVVGRMSNGQIQIGYVKPFSGYFTGWTLFAGGTPAGTEFVGSPVLAVNTNQRIEAFTLDSKGQMWHTYQIKIGEPIEWSKWASLGAPKDGLSNALEFQVFLMESSGHLRAIALGNDGKLYQSTQFEGGGPTGWTEFKVVGEEGGQKFVNGPAAAYCGSTGKAVYAGCNANSGSLKDWLVYYAEGHPSSPNWTSMALLPPQYPVQTAPPVLISREGTPHLFWLSQGTHGQVMKVSQQPGSVFWSTVKKVGTPQESFDNGLMSGVVNGTNVALFQRCDNAKLAYININAVE